MRDWLHSLRSNHVATAAMADTSDASLCVPAEPLVSRRDFSSGSRIWFLSALMLRRLIFEERDIMRSMNFLFLSKAAPCRSSKLKRSAWHAACTCAQNCSPDLNMPALICFLKCASNAMPYRYKILPPSMRKESRMR